MTPSLALGLILVVMGISFLMGFSFFKVFFSIIIIALGVKLLLRGRERDNMTKQTVSNDDYLNEVAIFSAINKSIKSDNFKNGKIVMVFAGGELDFRNTKTTQNEIDLDLTVVLGGAKILVPRNWKVNIQGVAILGGYDNKTEHGNSDVTLNIKGALILGGIEILN